MFQLFRRATSNLRINACLSADRLFSVQPALQKQGNDRLVYWQTFEKLMVTSSCWLAAVSTAVQECDPAMLTGQAATMINRSYFSLYHKFLVSASVRVVSFILPQDR